MNVQVCLATLLFTAFIQTGCAQETAVQAGGQPESQSVDSANNSLYASPLRSSFLNVNYGNDEEKMRRTQSFQALDEFQVDPYNDLEGNVLVRKDGDRFFYIFHNSATSDPAAPYFIQRVKKKASNYRNSNEDPEVEETYLVEALKNANGQLKAPDQHFGYYSLRGFERRVIEKTLEIGEIENNAAQSEPWPYNDRALFHQIQDYSPSRRVYDEVDFKRSKTWSIRFEFDATGNYSLQIPELGIDLPGREPQVPEGIAILDRQPEIVELLPGKGLSFLPLGTSEDQVLEILGAPIRIAGDGNKLQFVYDHRIFVQLVNSIVAGIYVDRDFSGSSDKGIRIGDSRSKVLDEYGPSSSGASSTDRFSGLQIEYDEDKVSSMYVYDRQLLQ